MRDFRRMKIFWENFEEKNKKRLKSYNYFDLSRSLYE